MPQAFVKLFLDTILVAVLRLWLLASSALLKADGISAGYGQAPMIQDVTLEVATGEIVVLLGANGAGKTTTLLALVGELPLMAGEVNWLGDSRPKPLYKRTREGLRFVTGEQSVISSLTVTDNLRLAGGSVAAAFELFPELRDRRHITAGLLSGGEQRMLALAGVLAAEPSVVVADELSLGLAPLVVERIFSSLRAAAQDRGVGVILVEQQVARCLDIADRGYVMRRGRIAFRASASELMDRTADIERAYLHEGAPGGSDAT